MKCFKKMVKITVVLMGLLAIAPPVAGSSDTIVTMKLLDAMGASFIIHAKEKSVSIITYDWKTPAETCTILKNANIVVDRVVNYEAKLHIMTFKNC